MRRAEEGHEDQPPGIKGGQARRDCHQQEGIEGAGRDAEAKAASMIASFEKKPAVSGKPVSASVPIDHHPEGEGNFLREAAHLAHVLLVMHGVDDRARAEEQQRLEEGMGEEMENAERIAADAEADEHVAELRTGRIGDDALDVVLHEADGRREKGRRAADDGDEGKAPGACSKSGDRRATMKTPAVTMVAAWIKAETGVGPSIASGSQVWSRNCADLPIAPMNSSRQVIVIASTSRPKTWIVLCARPGAAAKIVIEGDRIGQQKTRKMPSAKPKSPTRLTTKALIAAALAEGFSYQKPISR